MNLQPPLRWEGVAIPVYYKNIRHIYIHVETDGQVWLSAPMGTSQNVLQKCLERRWPWVQARRERICKQATAGAQLWIWGRPCRLEVQAGTKSFDWVEGRGEEPGCLYLPPGEEPVKSRQIKQAYQTMLRQAIEESLAVFEPRLQVRAAAVSVRNMKTRWGSCSIASGRIRLNAQLIHFPRVCLDYVIVHELCHLLIPGHDERFWAQVNHVFPNYRQVKKLLSAKG